MEFFVLLILLIFCVLGLVFSKSLISPEFLSPLSWCLIISIYSFFDHKMFDLSSNVLLIILIWNFFLLLGIYFSKFLLAKKTVTVEDTDFSLPLRSLYFKISLYGFLPTLYVLYIQLAAIPGDFFYKLRMANTGLLETKVSLGIFSYTLTFALVSYMIELITYKKGDSKIRLYLILVINVVFALSTMSKSSFLFLIFSSLIIILFKARVPVFKISKYVALTFILMYAVQTLRDGGKQDESGDSLFYTYLLGGLPALDKITDSEMESSAFGQNTLAFFNNISQKISGDEKADKRYLNDITDEGYVKTPNLTNVYTVIGPIWLDFKYAGVIFCSFIVGGLAGLFYDLSIKNRKWAQVVYAYFGCVLILQFFGEYIFTNMSYLIQLIILSYIPFKWRYKKIIWGK